MDCCKTLAGIARRCAGGNIAGTSTKGYVICIDRVDSIPAPADYENDNTLPAHTITDDVTLSTDDPGTTEVDETGVWYEWNHQKKSGSYVAEPIGDDGSEGWKITHTFFVPRLDPLATYIFNNTANGEFLYIFKDKNGEQRLLGNLEDGVSIKVKEQTNDKNGYEVTVEWETGVLPFYYTGAIVT